MKKFTSLLLALSLGLALLAGCAGQPATGGSNNEPDETPDSGVVVTEGAVKTGLSVVTTLSSSVSATAEKEGTIQTDVSLVAVTVDENGVIVDCAIDSVQAKMAFDTAGTLTGDLAAPIESKNELGDKYGMSAISPIGKEWNEQADAFAQYVIGKTADEVMGIAVNEETRPTDADLSSSVTIAVGGFQAGVVEAVNNAQHLGAQAGDELKIVTMNAFSAPDASEGAKSALQTDVNIAAVTMNGDTITSCIIDAVQAKVEVDAAGQLLTDTTAPVESKNQLGDKYGMSAISPIGKEWNEQAAAFAQYVTGKTLDEVETIAVNEETRPTDADLSSSVTIAVGGFQALLGKLGA